MLDFKAFFLKKQYESCVFLSLTTYERTFAPSVFGNPSLEVDLQWNTNPPSVVVEKSPFQPRGDTREEKSSAEIRVTLGPKGWTL